MKRKAIELAAEELDRARDWGAPGTVARSLRVLGLLEGAGRAGAARGGGRGRRRALLRGSSWPSRSPRSASLRRRAGRPDYAREPLTRAHELAEVCGAERLLAQIRTEMLAVGVEPALGACRAAWRR